VTLYLERDFDLKNTFFSKETKFTEGIMALRKLFKSEGTEKEGEEKNSTSIQAKGGRREKSYLTTQENFWCDYK